MRHLFGIGLLSLSLALGGCGWLFGEKGYFRDRGDDYRKAEAIPPMRMPDDKPSEAIQPIYGIPVEKTDALLSSKFEVPRPTPLVGDQDMNTVRIQKLGEEEWILLDGAPGAIWPRLRAFLVSNHIGLEREDASTGQMETAWLAFKSDATRRERYRFRVEQGVQRNSTEIYIQQLGYTKPENQDPPPPEWGTGSTDTERESWMVRQLANYLAETIDDSSVSLLAQGISTVNKVYLVRDQQQRPAIDLRLPYERAWASLGRALERAEFTVQDLDQSAGVYYVKYEPGKNDEKDGKKRPRKGFFKTLFGWWGNDDEENPAIGHSYRVEMRSTEKGVLISVYLEDKKKKDFEEGEMEFVLGAIKSHLA